jgi:hypothetical protein
VRTPPVIYIFFNRPDVMARSLAAIRAARPSRLHLIADGPRTNKPGEAERCAEARALVEKTIDWPCEVTRDFSPTNLGCGRRLSSGLTTAFELLVEAVVIEDDIVPHPDFFAFCAVHLERHRDDAHVHTLCGFNPLNKYQPRRGPAVASLHNSIWGWASWQRSWKDYRFDMAEWNDPAVKQTVRATINDDLLFGFYRQGFDDTASGQLDSWDFQWSYAMMKHRRVALTSTVNFIENIGFHGAATHTHHEPGWFRGLRTGPAVSAPQQHSLTTPDRRHDHLHNLVTMGTSGTRIAVTRFAAGSTTLTRLLAP